ncbi:extracellular solute-binding protein [Streptomyces showdoensis]|uniref:ABC transporter substrate-binding protein n=1 Tax=Streptomyces showdoensis TaxID=68268 RepID=A0A2P2GFM2_STREW|nr:extracellular solute-binding protein [Streptomyces showdoensis]KKZ70314.1 ABC transporter substrate-binding protein [Streptomyces showdoensis]
MQRRRFLGLAAAASALGLTGALSGCGTLDAESGDVTLKLIAADYDLGGGDSTKKYWAGVVSAFEAKNPGVKVQVQIESWNDVDRKVAELVKAGQAPDIAQIGAYADYAAAGQLYAADELLSIRVQANFLAPLVAAGEHKRTQYGLPFVASTRLLFFNEDLFDKAGVSAPPTTWDELAAAARKLEKKGVKYPFALPLGPEEAQAETMMWLLSGGDGYTDATDHYKIDSEANVRTFEWLRTNLVAEGLTGPVAPGKLNRKEAFAAFARGEVGMLNGHPSLMQEAEKQGVKVGKIALPGASGKARATMGVADWIMGFKQNGHRKEIGAFLDFAFSDENVLKFAGDNDLLPATITASARMESDPEHAGLREFLQALPDAQLPPVGKTSWAQVSGVIKKDIGQAVAPDAKPAEVLGRIARAASTAESAE